MSARSSTPGSSSTARFSSTAKFRAPLAVAALLLVALAAYLLAGGGDAPPPGPGQDAASSSTDGDARRDALGAESTLETDDDPARRVVGSLEGDGDRQGAVIRGVVLDARTLQPLPGVQVAALRTPPTVERFFNRIRNAFFSGEGLKVDSSRPAELLATTVTGADGSFELTDLPPGLAFVDARADFAFVRNPAQVRVANGEVQDGLELLASRGGRVQGTVRGPDGRPLPGAVVSLRPGINAFLGQLSQKRYRWLEGRSDENGFYDLAGVPTGSGYVLSAAGPGMALEEVFQIEVQEDRVTVVDIDGHPGARIAGQVLDPDGAPLPGAEIAMVYLDVSRVLFSADGRAEPITTDETGRFATDHVAAGRIGFIALMEGMAPSNIADLAVVDDGVYEDLVLRIGVGAQFAGVVVDDQDRPIVGALVEVRPIERPRDPDFVKLALRVREVDATTDSDGQFVAEGLDGDRLFVQISKLGYVTSVKFGVELAAEEPPRFVLTRGVTVSGRVLATDGTPLTRFSVNTRSREVDPETGEPARRDRRRGPPWQQQGGMRLNAGQRMGDQQFGDRWQEIKSSDGSFELTGLPPGEIRVRVRAEGWRDPDSQTVTLAAGTASEPLEFRLDPGATARGVVTYKATGAPVPEALVTAYRNRDADNEDGADTGQRGPPAFLRGRIDPEDFDLLGIADGSRRSDRTDSRGEFEIDGLAGGDYRFTARHPDLAKASATEIVVPTGGDAEGIVIEVDQGGSIEGVVTGRAGQPLVDALIAAFSIQAGALESASTDAQGRYRIEGLAPGGYIVFKTRMDERATNLGYDIMSNLRLKTVRVQTGKVTTLDIEDETEDGVRVYGRVLDGGQPVGRALITALGEDRDGLFGMGIRAQPSKEDGTYEMVLSPGDYTFQVTRFAGRPQQTSLYVEVPFDQASYRLDLELPQSTISGRVIDSQGQPVVGIRIAAGSRDAEAADAPGLLGLMLQNGVSQARTGDDGTFTLKSIAAGTYRVTASGRRLGGRRGGDGDGEQKEFGEAAIDNLLVDGITPLEGLEIVLPRAGVIEGTVLDGSGNPVTGAEIVASRQDDDGLGEDSQRAMLDLFGVQLRPVRSNSEGRFTLRGLTPGTYQIRADADDLNSGAASDVVVYAEQTTPLQLQVVRGATLKVRARNVDGKQLPLANITVLDGRGNPVASGVSVTSIFRRVMGSKQETSDTGWYTIGNVPPDTYTVIVREPGQPELRVTREIKDGEEVEWDVDATAELEAAGRNRDGGR